MKRILLILIALVLPYLGFSQVGINTNSPNASSALDVTATDKGVLLPQVDLQSLNDATTIASPAKSLLIWNTGATWGDSAYYYNNGTAAAPVWNKFQDTDDVGTYEYVENTSTGTTLIGLTSTWITPVSLTIPSDGVWDITGEALFATDQGRAEIRIVVNGSAIGTIEYSQFSEFINTSYGHKFQNNLTLSTGDIVGLQVREGFGVAELAENFEPARIWAKKVADLLPVTVDITSSAIAGTGIIVSGDTISNEVASVNTVDMWYSGSVVMAGGYGLTTLPFNQTIKNTDNWFNTTTNRFTPQKAGYWNISVGYRVYSNAATEGYLQIRKNGSSIVSINGGIGLVIGSTSKAIYFNGTTDYIQVESLLELANTNAQNQSTAYFTATYVGN